MPTSSIPLRRRLNEREAAAELGLSIQTLQQWRARYRPRLSETGSGRPL